MEPQNVSASEAPRPSINETPMTGAERQARYRATRAAGVPVIRHSPGAIAHAQVRPYPLLQFGCVGLGPSEGGAVVHLDTAIQQHEFEIAVADGKLRYHRTAHRITSALNCRPLKDCSCRGRAAFRRFVIAPLYLARHTDKSCNRAPFIDCVVWRDQDVGPPVWLDELIPVQVSSLP